MAMEKFEKLKKAIHDATEDAEKFYGKGNRAAGTRLRQQLLAIKDMAQDVRVEVSAIKAKQ